MRLTLPTASVPSRPVHRCPQGLAGSPLDLPPPMQLASAACDDAGKRRVNRRRGVVNRAWRMFGPRRLPAIPEHAHAFA